MALDSEIGSGTESRERDLGPEATRPELGTMAIVELGRALDTSPRLAARRSSSSIERLHALRRLRLILEDLERVDVAQALSAGASFEDVGTALGMSRSAAHRKHGGQR